MSEWITEIVYAADTIIRLGFAIRIIMRRRPVGVSLAWLMVLLFPFVGPLAYLTFGELRLGRRRAEWAARIHGPFEEWMALLRKRKHVDWSNMASKCEPLSRLVEATVSIPPLAGNELLLIRETDDVFRSIIADIEAARKTCHLEFYIWHTGGHADEVAETLIRAVGRGVVCRVLIDAVGSSRFLGSPMANKMRDAGIAVVAALPGGLIRSLFVRFDLRLHRKIVVIDGDVGYTGSLNLVDPRYFKQDAGVGQWVDAMVRVRGPVVETLAGTFLEDWELETGEGVERLRETASVHECARCGDAVIQTVPSGPLLANDAIRQIVLMAIYAARRELVMTTPYFVPDEALLTALMAAAGRGVDVTVIVPAKVDSRLVALASQAHKGDMIQAGIHVVLFDGGLLHTKSITIDGEICLFGSLNLDPRSMYLNFEITLCIYDADFTGKLRDLQQSYIEQSEIMDLGEWQSRSSVQRFAENSARLLGPLL